VILLAATLSLFMSVGEIGRARRRREFVILVLLAAVGMMVMVSGVDLIVIFLGLS
jgi:NADH:ubiquinone oxidoreductase subunit 2 (subunit N)